MFGIDSDAWPMIGLIVGGLVVWSLFIAWRYPEKRCWYCDAVGRFITHTPILGIKVRGNCFFCGGYGWRDRRLSRIFPRHRKW